MATQTEGSAAWAGALTLRERLALLRAAGDSDSAGFDAALAERRLARWRGQPVFARDGLFARRLAADGLSESEARHILGESLTVVAGRAGTAGWPGAGFDWRAEVAAALASLPADVEEPAGGGTDDDPGPAMLDAFEPFIARGVTRLRAGIERLLARYPSPPFDPESVVPPLFGPLPQQVFDVVGRTLALEVNVARLQGLLSGDTPAERFASFVRRLGRREHLAALLGEYPVLARQVAETVDRWATVSLEFLTHLAVDAGAVRELAAPAGELGVLEEVQGGLGDRHRGGRSVLIARFSGGGRVVYKPRSMTIDAAFQALLAWLNERGAAPAYRTLRVVDRGDHGWVEFVTPAPCSDADAVRRFYERQGGLLALLHALAATDFHFENLIAAGEHPVLLDLEAMLQPRAPEEPPADSPSVALRALHRSVYGVGLLPQRLWGNAEHAGVDISGLGGTGGQLTPHGVPVWEAAGTDEMRLERRRMPLDGGRNRPTVDGAEGAVEVGVADHAGALVEGFRRGYRRLVDHREALLAPGGPLAAFTGAEVRIVLRPTQNYATLLYDGYHPDALRDALDRDRLYDRLWGPVPYQALLGRVVPFEQADLAAGDIPIFWTRPDSLDLHATTGTIPGYFAETGLDHVRRRLAAMDDADLDRQLWVIAASLATGTGTGTSAESGVLSAEWWTDPLPHAGGGELRAVTTAAAHDSPCRPRGGGKPAGRPPSRSALSTQHSALVRARARAVGRRLAALAIRGDRDVGWLGLTLERGVDWAISPLDADLYDGLAGVALFLGYLAALDPGGGHAELAEATLATVLRGLESRPDTDPVGAFTGWSGPIYALTHLGGLRGRPELLRRAHELVDRLISRIERDDALDVIAGSAGCIGALAALEAVSPSPRTRAAIRAGGERLLARATEMPVGLGWAPVAGQTPLLGFSHGTAGIGWALLEAASTTGDERFRQAAFGALAYERSRFSPERGNWPDLRPHDDLFGPREESPHPAPLPSQGERAPSSPRSRRDGSGAGGEGSEPSFMLAWCHGAPGIALGRIGMLRRLAASDTERGAVSDEATVALRSTLAGGFGGNQSLCHGDLGNLDALLEAARTLDPGWRGPAAEAAAAIVGRIEREGPRCGNLLGVETPGLMTGLAGIGYGLLRLADPTRVPSVLLLAPPAG